MIKNKYKNKLDRRDKADDNVNKKISKKSQAHVEMIISFTVFIGAVLLIFIFINPVKNRQQDSSVEDVQRIIIENISKNIEKVSVIVGSVNDCYEPIYGNKFIEVKDSERKYTLYFNLSETTSFPSCQALTSRNYTYGVYSRESIVNYEKILDLANSYRTDYSKVKSDIGILKDFSFRFKDNNQIIEELSVSKDAPRGLEVYSEDIPLRVINNSASIKNMIMNLKVW